MAVRVADTTVTNVYGVGPVVAAYLIGYTGDVARFATKARYAAVDNATAPVEASSGPKPRHRLNLKGNRQLNHALHMAAVTQISHDTAGRDYYQRKLTETQKQEGSDARAQTTDQRRRLRATARRRVTLNESGVREGKSGTTLQSRVAG